MSAGSGKSSRQAGRSSTRSEQRALQKAGRRAGMLPRFSSVATRSCRAQVRQAAHWPFQQQRNSVRWRMAARYLPLILSDSHAFPYPGDTSIANPNMLPAAAVAAAPAAVPPAATLLVHAGLSPRSDAGFPGHWSPGCSCPPSAPPRPCAAASTSLTVAPHARVGTPDPREAAQLHACLQGRPAAPPGSSSPPEALRTPAF